jgi:predicted amidohydrolase
MTKPDTLKVAAAQYPIDQPENLAAWEAKIRRWVAEGSAAGAQLLVFPEYAAIEQAAAFGPKVYGDLKETLERVADQTHARVALHVELAQQHNVHILVGSGPAKRGDAYVNAAQLATPKGQVGVQEKLVMTPFEHDWGMSAGTALRVFDTALGRIGIAICYDSEFPLLARGMAAAGAEVVLVPSCTERVSGFHRVRIGAQARALENQIATVTSPTVGDALWSPAVDRNAGAAGVFVPPEALLSDSGVVAEGTLDEPGWVTGTIDLKRLRKLRGLGEMRNFADWPRQPGLAAEPAVEVVNLV